MKETLSNVVDGGLFESLRKLQRICDAEHEFVLTFLLRSIVDWCAKLNHKFNFQLEELETNITKRKGLAGRPVD